MSKNNGLDRTKQAQQAKRTNLAEWWANQFVELDLPSGLHVVVRDVDIEDLLANGVIPNTLMSLFPELQGMSDEDATKKVIEEHPDSYSDLLSIIVKYCFVEPKVGDVTDGISTIALSDIRGKDKRFVFEWANREVKQLSSFREGERKPLESS